MNRVTEFGLRAVCSVLILSAIIAAVTPPLGRSRQLERPTSAQMSAFDEIGTVDLLQIYNRDDVLIIDLRTEDEYLTNHMSKAALLPAENINQLLGEKTNVVVYGVNAKDIPDMLIKAVERRRVRLKIYRVGIAEWASCGLPLTADRSKF